MQHYTLEEVFSKDLQFIFGLSIERANMIAFILTHSEVNEDIVDIVESYSSENNEPADFSIREALAHLCHTILKEKT